MDKYEVCKLMEFVSVIMKVHEDDYDYNFDH